MKRYYYFLLLLFFVMPVAMVSAQQTPAQKWTPDKAKKWVNDRAWSNGVSLILSPSANNVKFAQQYEMNKNGWDMAFKFLANTKLDTLAPGKYVIDGTNVYATITEAPSKEFDKSAWESHRNYIDLHYVIRGEEKIGVAHVESATVTNAYDAVKDVANYTADGKYYIASPKEFFLFFPGDAHRPNIKAEGYDTVKVKKLVIKIRYIN